ncbi:hypothetical protein KP509_10G065600 [Ceratopteris richardii]|uniref:Uncharacterized protein n=1 Tax=Ceratopteris richardii TaxID=49495 RepID=A0A8T2TZT6_CERRI|nr:hypothetical protein KP509_10G065600 [Ceratopteris richardii]KAH7427889.1 hypothetical protein KP509_10G065600 [Ceratopteris richardii]
MVEISIVLRRKKRTSANVLHQHSAVDLQFFFLDPSPLHRDTAILAMTAVLSTKESLIHYGKSLHEKRCHRFETKKRKRNLSGKFGRPLQIVASCSGKQYSPQRGIHS